MRFDFERANDYEYVVKKGDSLYTIAQKYNVTVDELLKANGLKSALIYPNQVLIIPMNKDGSLYFVEYVVKENDTLNSIADKYNVSLNEMKNYNNFEKLYLLSDQVITIPLNMPSEKRIHKVVATDTIDYLLRKYNITLEELVYMNQDKILVIGSYLNVK